MTSYTVVRRPGADRAAVRWQRHWETALDAADHAAVAGLLRRSFPATAAFADGRSWAGARPELRIVGCLDDHPVAHAAVIRRFLRVPEDDTSVLVGDVGLVAVDPDAHGRRIGGRLMGVVADALAGLAVPFGFLTCAPELRPFYERCGWTALTEHPIHSINIHHQVEHLRRNGMVLPVLAAAGEWPAGSIERDGQEI